MANETVTNRDLYDAIEKLEEKIVKRIDKIESRVEDNTTWRNQLTGKIAALMAVVGLAINLVWDRLFNR